MSSEGGDGPSRLTYKRKICPKCGYPTEIKVSHSHRNPNKLYYRCNTHAFVGWCVPTNDGAMNPTDKEEKRDEDHHDIKISLKNKVMEIIVSCKDSCSLSLLFSAVIVLGFMYITFKVNVM